MVLGTPPPSLIQHVKCDLSPCQCTAFPNACHQRICPASSLHCLPEIVRIERFRKLWVDIDDMDIPTFDVPYSSFVEVPCLIRLDVDS